jgi:hypothetical protein
VSRIAGIRTPYLTSLTGFTDWGYQSTGRKSNLALKLQDCQFIRDLPLAGPRECNRVAKASTKRKGDFEMSLRSKKKKSEQEAE